MKIALLHHHLRPGGVTRVLASQALALQGRAQVVVLSGEAPKEPLPAPCEVIRPLAYQRELAERVPPAEVARRIRQTARADLYHFHNPTLGKNPDLPEVIRCLQAAGERVLLQIHDFAEDGRTSGRGDYPADCHYAVINRRDRDLLCRAGLLPSGVHYLPNPVRPLAAAGGRGGQRLILYPVRAIRRKNLGEALLLSLFFPRGVELGVTQDPTSAEDLGPFQAWRDTAASLGLPARFSLGRKGLGRLLAESRAVLTTSVKEGFGLGFLEPWTAGRMVHGRLLPDVCADFTAEGLRLEHLYPVLRVPCENLDAAAFRRQWLECYRGRRARLGLEPDTGEGERFVDALLSANALDFGRLGEELQQGIVREAAASPLLRSRLLELNPHLEQLFSDPAPEPIVRHNREAVLTRFSLEKAASRLLTVYGQVLGDPVRQSLDASALARAFNSPDRILLLQCPPSCALPS